MRTLVESLKSLVKKGKVTKEKLQSMVEEGTITEAEYEYITGESYV